MRLSLSLSFFTFRLYSALVLPTWGAGSSINQFELYNQMRLRRINSNLPSYQSIRPLHLFNYISQSRSSQDTPSFAFFSFSSSNSFFLTASRAHESTSLYSLLNIYNYCCTAYNSKEAVSADQGCEYLRRQIFTQASTRSAAHKMNMQDVFIQLQTSDQLQSMLQYWILQLMKILLLFALHSYLGLHSPDVPLICLALVASLVSTVLVYRNPGYFIPLFHDSKQVTELAVNSARTSPIAPQCRWCQREMLLRMKHCFDCRVCVPTFDHHCGLLGICIGEKNRPLFLVTVWIEIGQIFAWLWIIGQTMYMRGDKSLAAIFCACVLTVSVTMLLFLGLLHVYLMGRNLTTYELLQWRKIEYLQGYPERQSPWDRKLLGNIKMYWEIACQRDLHCYKQPIG